MSPYHISLTIFIGWFILAFILSETTGMEFDTAMWRVPLFIGIAIVSFWVILGIRAYSKLPSKEQKAREAEERERVRKQRELELETKRQHQIAQLSEAIKIHHSALMRNIERSIIKNDYGAVVENNHEEAIKEFAASVGFDVSLIGSEIVKEMVLQHYISARLKNVLLEFDINSLPTDGHEFEHWVADGLNKFDWDAKVTVASGDQGIDVIAKKNGKTIGLQCKLLKSSVGNKAVQEAHAGKAFHQMDVVGVISNASYTKSAKALAADTGVKLLSHHDIPNLYEKMFNE